MIGRLNVNNGVNIKGVIEEYTVAAGENISAGDFVSFVNDHGSNTSIVNNSYYEGYVISAVALSESKVFIAHSRSTSSGSITTNQYLYAVVCTINGTTITAETDTLISDYTYSGNYISAGHLSDH